MLLFRILGHLLAVVAVHCDCGLPAIPDLTKLSQFKSRYDEQSVVGYECEDSSSELIDGKYRTCADNRWNGSLPRCAKLIPTDLLTRIQISELKSHKQLYREMQFSPELKPRRVARVVNNGVKYHECSGERYLWHLNQNQIWSFFIKRTAFFNYFSLYLKMESLLEYYNTRRLLLKARVEDSSMSLHCRVERFHSLNDTYTHKIGFVCDESNQNIVLHEGIDETVTRIVITAHVHDLTNKTIIFCDLKLYEISDSCGAPERPLNSVQLAREKTYSVYSCRDGYRLEGQQKIKCGTDGNWQGQFPLCIPVKTCKIPATEVNDPYLRVQYRHYYTINGVLRAEPDDVATYSCENMNGTIRMEGLNTRVCKDGKWSGSQPVCQSLLSTNDSTPMSYQSGADSPIDMTGAKMASTTKIFIIIMAMLGSFFIGGVSVAIIVVLIVEKRNNSRKRPKVSIIIDETDSYIGGEHYASLRGSLASNVSNELANPLYDEYKRFNKNTLNIPLEDNAQADSKVT